MKHYLSSYRIGNNGEKLKEMIGDGKIGFILNSKDFHNVHVLSEKLEQGIKTLNDLGLNVEHVDLKDYFGRKEDLKKKLDELLGVWVAGGNVFVLRQAMYLSGFDEIMKNIERDNFVYSGDSAGACVLSPNLEPYNLVDDPNLHPYEELNETIWEGLGILDYVFLPHYKSNHEESRDVDKTVDYCESKGIPYKTLKDGEVIVIE
ncbi:MAG: Type 1 glutamine amidotransferase-like domain-containing protein [Candidatus Pacearchaeota archaeon]